MKPGVIYTYTTSDWATGYLCRHHGVCGHAICRGDHLVVQVDSTWERRLPDPWRRAGWVVFGPSIDEAAALHWLVNGGER